MRRILVLALSLAARSAFACGSAPDHIRELDVIGEQSLARLEARDFAGLDRLVREYRSPTAMSSEGLPKLSGFYITLGAIGKGSCDAPAVPDEKWAQRRRLLNDWLQASTDKLAPRIALAELENSFGWSARGGGYADTVSEQGWKLFRERLESSRKQLEAIGPAGSKDPAWFDAMLNLAVEQGWSNQRFEALFAKAVKAHPYYLSLYFAKGRYYSAKWHGSKAQYDQFVDASVQATAATMGPSMYARLHWSAWSPDMFENGQTDWPRMRAAFERIMQDFPDGWNRNNFAKFACMADDQETLRRQLDLIGEKIIHSAWRDDKFLSYCRRFAATDPKLLHRITLPAQ